MSSPIYMGGLGILDLGDINKALVAKWICNYANSREALWTKVVCARSKGNPSSLMLVMKNIGNNLVLWKFVELVIERLRWAREVIDQQFRILIGDEHDMNF